MNLRAYLDSLKPKRFVIPVDMQEEWGCEVFVRSLTRGESEDITNSELKELDQIDSLFCAVLCDSEGNAVYNYPDDKQQLRKYALTDINKILAASGNIHAVQIENEKKAER